MSDSAIIIAELSVSTMDAPARAATVAAWLLNEQIIKPNDQPDSIWQPSRYRAGPSVASAAPDFSKYRGLANNGVDLLDHRQVHHPGGNYTPPTCPHCDAPLDQDAHVALVEPWLDHHEPLVTCTNCATTTLLGDWTGQWAIHVANLAVRFNNWPPLSDTFFRELCDHLGPRCRLIFMRI